MVIILWKYNELVFFLHIQPLTPYCGYDFQENSDLR